MISVRQWTFGQVLAVILCVLIAAEAYSAGAQTRETPISKFTTARRDFSDGNYGAARQELQGILSALDENKLENRSFLGHVHVLLGACYEKMGDPAAAEKAYRKAVDLLSGEDPGAPGVNLSGLPVMSAVFGPGKTAGTPPVPPVQPSPPRQADETLDPQAARFLRAKELYFGKDFEGAKKVLEAILIELNTLQGKELLKGQVCLLMGATYEALKSKESAIRYYCLAKTLLGEGKTIQGLDLKSLKFYAEPCGGGAVAGAASTGTGAGGRTGIGKVIGALLILSVIGGLVWFLFFSKNAPLGSKAETKTTFSSACFTSLIDLHTSATWEGAAGSVSI
jgi:hypothetical protein